MNPKVEASCDYVRTASKRSAIWALADTEGEAGKIVVDDWIDSLKSRTD